MDTYLGKCGTYPEVVVSRVTDIGIIATKKLIEYRIMREGECYQLHQPAFTRNELNTNSR